MDNNISSVTQAQSYASAMSQLNLQSDQQAKMQHELQTVKSKLEQASKKLAQKEQIIGSLELDLEHMIEQLRKIQLTRVHML